MRILGLEPAQNVVRHVNTKSATGTMMRRRPRAGRIDGAHRRSAAETTVVRDFTPAGCPTSSARVMGTGRVSASSPEAPGNAAEVSSGGAVRSGSPGPGSLGESRSSAIRHAVRFRSIQWIGGGPAAGDRLRGDTPRRHPTSRPCDAVRPASSTIVARTAVRPAGDEAGVTGKLRIGIGG